MRTTITIDDDVLAAARQLAAVRNEPIGRVISELARASLTEVPSGSERNGIVLLPATSGAVVTLDDVNRLRDEHA